MNRACNDDAGHIDRSGHRRIGLEDVDIHTLPVEQALANGQPPADIDVEGQDPSQHDRHHEYGDDGVQGRYGPDPVAGGLVPGKPQSDIERRRWLCVTTRADDDVCTAHLSTRDTAITANTNDAQCAELRQLLARRAHTRRERIFQRSQQVGDVKGVSGGC